MRLFDNIDLNLCPLCITVSPGYCMPFFPVCLEFQNMLKKKPNSILNFSVKACFQYDFDIYTENIIITGTFLLYTIKLQIYLFCFIYQRTINNLVYTAPFQPNIYILNFLNTFYTTKSKIIKMKSIKLRLLKSNWPTSQHILKVKLDTKI